ncbi:3-phenylpropionate/cinnamic acid dioxygenase ferredoxin--NAD(+) reductase subunit [Paraburkholderia adhaesiva]|uniref:3-phenylpropionate/cinnamic acid dioxygenase ferredoxin--NAD(+) reductase subunit n=1 Tax=Paraburkholderia adhaesiva TaxID=2883244 RepID=UPI001F368A67|nr:3-phenylpropionate/cinnamic acid dioxygenase ferredoxin--NAD(+) reductase subunit [Paraburkholderia adhaesiva]
MYVIAGAGQAGATAAAELRRRGFDGRVILIGEEAHFPYERPPLSKDMLIQPDATRSEIFADSFYAEQKIELRRGLRVLKVDPQAHTLDLDDGSTVAYDKLLIATGSRARRLPMLDCLARGIHVLRTLDDAQALRAELMPGRRILIVGGGVIGLELASSLVDLGTHVTVIERADSVMGRCAPAPLRSYLCDLHRERGVTFHLGASLESARREAGDIVLELADGTLLRGDAVVYGVGAEPCTEAAVSANLKISGGIVIDEYGRTSDSDIYAAGDVTSQWDSVSHQWLRRETWENANRQALTAARAMLGVEEAETGVPWFWTDQCGRNIQLAGDMEAPQWLIRGDVNDAGFIWLGVRDDVVVGAVAVNKGREMRHLKALIAARCHADSQRLLDPTVDLRKMMQD